jgi:hypothetical protein
MEIQTLTWEDIIRSIQERSAESQAPLILEARIAISPHEMRLLEVQLDCSLEIIRY